jgi:aryl-alcohol dehydrogenase-like predicted oxidoreductase
VKFADLDHAEARWQAEVYDGARWVSFPGHILEARRLLPVVRGIREAGAEVLLTNPLAEGRLDGRWLSEGTLAQDGPPRPMDLPSLQRAYAPVLPLGFLTTGRRRTLAQAAIGFVRAIGAIPSVRFRDIRQIAELVDGSGADPLSEDELERVTAVLATVASR